ncbi:MAG: sensor histidine kinase [Candidatus Limnocylindrales bacterium]
MTIGLAGRRLRVGRGSSVGPVATRRLLDAFTLALAFAMFARMADPEILLQALWVIIGIGAFVYGLRMALGRIAIVAVAVPGYTFLSARLQIAPFEPMDTMDFVEWPLMAAIGIIVAVLADRIATSAQRYAGLYRQASERLLTAHEDERARVARDLHDGVGQTLTAVVLTLDAAETELRGGPTPASYRALTSIRRAQTLAADALEEARDVASRLRPTRIHEIGLGAAIRNLAPTAGVPVEVRFGPRLLPPGLLEPDAELEAYRIVQEAIGNAARHSYAKSVWVDGEIVDGSVHLMIGDDGIGFDESATGRGLGLAGMRERATILHGRLDVRSVPGSGTTIGLVLPVKDRPVRSAGRPVPIVNVETVR